MGAKMGFSATKLNKSPRASSGSFAIRGDSASQGRPPPPPADSFLRECRGACAIFEKKAKLPRRISPLYGCVCPTCLINSRKQGTARSATRALARELQAFFTAILNIRGPWHVPQPYPGYPILQEPLACATAHSATSVD